MNSECPDDRLWRTHLEANYGSIIALKAVGERQVIPARLVSQIDETSIPPNATLIYKELISTSLTASDWSDIFFAILKCRYTVHTRLPSVYKAVYETLCGKPFDVSIYFKIPQEERDFWENTYVRDPNDYSNQRNHDAHQRECSEHVRWLAEFCNHKCIKIPGFEIKDYYIEDPEFHQMSLDLQKHTEALQKKIQDTEAQLRAQEIHNLSEISEIECPDDKVRVNQDQGSAPSSAKSQGVQSDTKVKKGVELGTVNPNTIQAQSVNSNPNQNPPFNPAYKSGISTHKKALDDYQFNSNPSTVRFTATTQQPTASSPKYILQEPSGHQYTASIPRHILQQSTVEVSEARGDKSMSDDRLRVRDFLPSKFDGRSLSNDPDSHLLSYSDYISGQKGVTNLDDVELTEKDIDMFKYTLQGDARLWYEANAPFGSLKELESAFLREFAPEMKSDTTAARAFAELTYNPRTKLTAYVNKFMRLNRTLNYEDNVLRDRFMSSMPVEIRRLAKLGRPNTFKSAVEEVKKVLEDTPDESTTTKNAVAMVGEDYNDMNEMSLAMHTIRRQVDNLNRRIGDSPVNYYSENDVNLRPQTNTGFQCFQNQRKPFGGPGGRGNFMQDRPRYSQGQNNQQLNQINGPSPFTPTRGRGQQAGNGGRSAMPQMVCRFCNRRGHFERDCWFKWGTNEVDRGNNQPNRGNFQPGRGSYQSNRGSYYSNRGNYQANRGGYQYNRGNYQNNRGHYQSNRGGYQYRQNGDNDRQRPNQQ